ncbi:hypothetical protein JW960_02425 [candidate division KSB1 bacterium]|nr:hypothetical protein [candidate division KSB1 bacterium]
MEATQNASSKLNSVLEQLLTSKQPIRSVHSHEKRSLTRLIANSRHIESLLTKRLELKNLRFDELELLHDIRELVEHEPQQFEEINDPALYRRELRSKILPRYITPEFIRQTQEKIINVLLKPSLDTKDQDALMTAMVFLQSHTDLGIECQENPLWEIIFNLSIKDGIRFVDSLTALIEGLDSLRSENPDLLHQEPFLLQKTMQVSQWPVFWRALAAYRHQPNDYDALTSAILRGELRIELYFDEIVHLPLLLYKQFKDVLSDSTFFEDQLEDVEREDISQQLVDNLLECCRRDLPELLPVLVKRLRALRKTITDPQLQTDVDAFLIQCKDDPASLDHHIVILTLLVAKISIRSLWENKRDFLFFMTVLRDPELPNKYYDFGHILYKLKQADLVRNVFQCAVDLDSTSFWGYWGLGHYHLKKNELDQSEAALTQALKIVQQREIHNPGRLRREVFLIKDDIKALKQKKVKFEAKKQEQIDLFG